MTTSERAKQVAEQVEKECYRVFPHRSLEEVCSAFNISGCAELIEQALADETMELRMVAAHKEGRIKGLTYMKKCLEQTIESIKAREGALLLAAMEQAAQLVEQHNRDLMERWNEVIKEPHLQDKIRAIAPDSIRASFEAAQTKEKADAASRDPRT